MGWEKGIPWRRDWTTKTIHIWPTFCLLPSRASISRRLQASSSQSWRPCPKTSELLAATALQLETQGIMWLSWEWLETWSTMQKLEFWTGPTRMWGTAISSHAATNAWQEASPIPLRMLAQTLVGRTVCTKQCPGCNHRPSSTYHLTIGTLEILPGSSKGIRFTFFVWE